MKSRLAGSGHILQDMGVCQKAGEEMGMQVR